MRVVQISKYACLSILVEIRSNSFDLANRSVKTRLFVVLNTNLRLETTMIVISSITMEFDKQCAKSPPLVVLNTICSFTRMPDVQFQRYTSIQKLIEIRSNSNELAKRCVRTRYFVILSAILLSESKVLHSMLAELDELCHKSPHSVLQNMICSFTRAPYVHFSRYGRKQKLIDIRSNTNEFAKRIVITRYFVVLSKYLHSESKVFVIRSISMELDKLCVRSLP